MAKKTTSTAQPTGIILIASYALLYIVNAVILYLSHMLFPKAIVLGNMSLSAFWGMFLSMNALALIDTAAIPFAHVAEQKMRRMLTSKEWMIIYFVLNFVGIWVISRFSVQFGLGISNWYVAVALALVLDIVQGVAMMSLQKSK